MKPGDMRELTTEELQHKHDELQHEYFGLRIKHALGQLENPLMLRDIRRDIARAKTLLTERGVPEVSRRRHLTKSASRASAKKSSTAAESSRKKSEAGSSSS